MSTRLLSRHPRCHNDVEAPGKGLDGKAAGDDGAYVHTD